ncbi:hypothetical protein FAM09_16025 [Niastella caeni]|uniref:Uncharacterized protein n=1 Tax=Niastella caeni TaxID=2569763 RepID=A0A4S8HRP5_9BACT|nr:hypothetical protein [Niastella caeni]THU38187.1 hypothetical protein FAM09_16025 [Niastella caeni]
MRSVFLFIVVLSGIIMSFLNKEVRLYKYLQPGAGTMTFNCTYNTFQYKGLHDTVTLNYKKFIVENEAAYCIVRTNDSNYQYSEPANFLGSAILFRNDSILLAPLGWLKPIDSLTLKDFRYAIPPVMKLTDSVFISLNDRDIVLSDFQYDTLTINGTRLDNCLKIKTTENYIGYFGPLYGAVWLSKAYGIVKWIRATERTEIRDLTKP